MFCEMNYRPRLYSTFFVIAQFFVYSANNSKKVYNAFKKAVASCQTFLQIKYKKQFTNTNITRKNRDIAIDH